MNIKKTAVIAAAVGAMAATAVPAMAMENEFHGMYRLRAMMSNFENANAAGALAKDAPTMSVFEQRARLQYTAKASDDLKLVTHFEIDSSWGDAAYSTTGAAANNSLRGTGGGMGADTVNLETKNVYLDFNCPLTGANVKLGIQPLTDAYKGIMFNDDVAAAVVSKKIAGVTGTAAFSRLQDFATATNSNPNPIGKNTLDLYLLDAKYAVNKDLTVGGAYYLVRNNPVGVGRGDTLDVHTVGVNAAAKFGMISGDAFLAYQGGSELAAAGRDLNAFAAQVAVKADLDKMGMVRGNVLYASGGKDSDSKAKAWQSLNSISPVTNNLGTSSNTYYDSKMVLLMRNIVNMDSDKALVQTINNSNRGVTLITVGYDTALTPKLGLTANIGYAMASQKQATDKSESLGTELNAQLDYKMFNNLTASLTGAYVILGDGLKYASNASTVKRDDPYLTSVMFNYTF